jgi:3-oxoacyl-[acyl-carrier protein] reductase
VHLLSDGAGGSVHGDLAGKVVLITGGARGIGAAVAVLAAQRGARVAIGYRSSEAAADLVIRRIEEAGGTAAAFAGDMGHRAEAQAVVDGVTRRLGDIDGLVNAAAVMATGDFLETDERAWDDIVRNDLYAVVHTCQAVLPGMLARGRGVIVNVSSRLAEAGSVDAAPYASIKAAVVTLTRSLALAYGPSGVRVNAVSPGTTNTDMGRAVIESQAGRARMERIPLRRFVEPEEVAAAIVFLLSDGASGFAGQTLHVNGGELMC